MGPDRRPWQQLAVSAAVGMTHHKETLTDNVGHDFHNDQGHHSQRVPGLLVVQVDIQGCMEAHKAKADIHGICICIAKSRAAGSKAMVHAVYMLVQGPDFVKDCVQRKEPGIMAKHGHCYEAPYVHQVVVKGSVLSELLPAVTDCIVQGNVRQANSKYVAGRMFCKRSSARDKSVDDAMLLQPDADGHSNCFCHIVCNTDTKTTNNSNQYCLQAAQDTNYKSTSKALSVAKGTAVVILGISGRGSRGPGRATDNVACPALP